MATHARRGAGVASSIDWRVARAADRYLLQLKFKVVPGAELKGTQ
jgi:hypothetical protein